MGHHTMFAGLKGDIVSRGLNEIMPLTVHLEEAGSAHADLAHSRQRWIGHLLV